MQQDTGKGKRAWVTDQLWQRSAEQGNPNFTMLLNRALLYVSIALIAVAEWVVAADRSRSIPSHPLLQAHPPTRHLRLHRLHRPYRKRLESSSSLWRINPLKRWSEVRPYLNSLLPQGALA